MVAVEKFVQCIIPKKVLEFNERFSKDADQELMMSQQKAYLVSLLSIRKRIKNPVRQKHPLNELMVRWALDTNYNIARTIIPYTRFLVENDVDQSLLS